MKLRLIDPEGLIPDAHTAAEEFFNNLAAGKGKVEDYDTPITDTTQQVATSPAFSAPKPARLLD